MGNRTYCVYILASPHRALYIGFTGGLEGRVVIHKLKIVKGFASKYNCTRLVYFEEYEDPNIAIAREKQLKGWRRAKKIALIEAANPAWKDLAEGIDLPEGASAADIRY